MNGVTQKTIEVVLRQIVEGKDEATAMANKYKAMGDTYKNVTASMTERATMLGNKQNFYREQMDRMGVTGAQVDRIMSHYGYTLDKNGMVIDRAGRSVENVNSLMDQGKIATRGFNMSLLSTMFFGMSLQRVFNGLLTTSLEWVGIQELMNTTLGIVFLPIAEDLLNVLLPIMDWFINLPEPVQEAIGAFTLLGAAVGTAMMAFGTLGLGLQGIGTTFGIDMAGGIIAGLKTKLGTINLSKYIKYGGSVIALGFAVKDLTEGQITAAIGMATLGVGLYTGNPYLIGIGVLLKIVGDDELQSDIAYVLVGIIDMVAQAVEWIADALKKAFSLDFDDIDFSFVSNFFDKMDEEAAKRIVSGRSSEFLKKRMLASGYTPGEILELGESTSVGDAIISPDGRVITTNPNDYLIATTSPETLGGGGSVNVTYHISGVSSPNDVRKMLEENNRKLVNEITRSVKR